MLRPQVYMFSDPGVIPQKKDWGHRLVGGRAGQWISCRQYSEILGININQLFFAPFTILCQQLRLLCIGWETQIFNEGNNYNSIKMFIYNNMYIVHSSVYLKSNSITNFITVSQLISWIDIDSSALNLITSLPWVVFGWYFVVIN